MEHSPNHNRVLSRIEQCRLLRSEARTPDEKEMWLAEEVGLLDALRGIDRTVEFRRFQRPSRFQRYELGLLDGQALKRLCPGTNRVSINSSAILACTKAIW